MEVKRCGGGGGVYRTTAHESKLLNELILILLRHSFANFNIYFYYTFYNLNCLFFIGIAQYCNAIT